MFYYLINMVELKLKPHQLVNLKNMVYQLYY